MTQAASRPRRMRTIVIAAVVIAVLLVVSLVFYGRGGGPLPGWLSGFGPDTAGLLDPSGPEEAVLRTLRLAGYDHATVGEDGGLVVVRVDIPYMRTPADAEMSWQTALGAVVGGFPRADRYVAQLFSQGEALLEVGIDGPALREMMDDPDAADRLKDEAGLVFLSEGGIGGG